MTETALHGTQGARATADRILAHVRAQDRVWGTYALDLTLDALLEVYRVTGSAPYRDHVRSVRARRASDGTVARGNHAFVHLNYGVYRALGDDAAGQVFVEEVRELRRNVARAEDGLVLHRWPLDAPARVLVDFMQDYVGSVARFGALTQDADGFAEAAGQMLLHRDVLLNRGTGLWSQGRGWDAAEPDALSPGAWSRGQGWILRGLCDALEVFPRGSLGFEAGRGVLTDLLDALIPLQDTEGLWHALVDRPLPDSEPETSGTALMTAALYRALRDGHVRGAAYRDAADRAMAAIAQRTDAGGRVHGACAGPGPLTRVLRKERYLCRSFPEDESHGCFAVLYACAARMALDGEGEITAPA